MHGHMCFLGGVGRFFICLSFLVFSFFFGFLVECGGSGDAACIANFSTITIDCWRKEISRLVDQGSSILQTDT